MISAVQAQYEAALYKEHTVELMIYTMRMRRESSMTLANVYYLVMVLDI